MAKRIARGWDGMVNEWMVESQDWSRPVSGGLAVALMRQLGQAGFAQTLLSEVNRRAAFEHCTIYALEHAPGSGVACRVLDAASRRAVPTAQRTSTLFAQKFARHDVNARYLAGPPPRHGLIATHFLSRDLPQGDYRDACYTRNGLVDRLSLVSVQGGGRALAINFYKGAQQGPTLASEREHLLWNAPLLAEAVTRHAALVRTGCGRSGAELLARVQPDAALTGREAELCRLLLDGLTVRDAASRMGIRPSSATTLKRRAFVRLGVRTREELLRHVTA